MIEISKRRYASLSVLALTAGSYVTGQNISDNLFNDCSLDEFYSSLYMKESDPSSWKRSDVINLITKMHRNVLPTIGEGVTTESDVAVTSKDGTPDDVMDALADLFPGTTGTNTIREWFRDIDMPVTPSNTPETWRRGDAWPRSAGAALNTPAATDVHTKWPIGWTVNDALQTLLMGDCNVVNDPSACIIPAVPEETALDTAQDGKIKTPPKSKRGDVARALMYNAIRYEEELGLQLTDCPPFGPTDYGYLSALLKWHVDDPVDSNEIDKNNRACSRWQGNRNIFVDYPQLVELYFGTPDTIVDGTYLYSKCTTPTDSPTATPNDCSSINPGDIQIYLFNSNNVPPPEDAKQLASQVVFFPLNEIPPGVNNLYLTDRAWNGTDFVTDEGVVMYHIPLEGIPPGDVFAYGVTLETDNGSWSDVSTKNDSSTPVPFLLSDQTGDSILLYCLNADNKPHFITGLIYNADGNWSQTGLETYGFNESALPIQLKKENEGHVALPLNANYLYVGPQSGKRSDLVVSFKDPVNYNGSLTAYRMDTAVTTSSATSVSYSVIMIITTTTTVVSIIVSMFL